MLLLLLRKCNKDFRAKVRRTDTIVAELRKRLDAFSKLSPEELALADAAVPKDENNKFTPTQPQQYSRSIDYRQYVGDLSCGVPPSVNISAIVCDNCGYPKGHHHNGNCPTVSVYNVTNKKLLKPYKGKRKKLKS